LKPRFHRGGNDQWYHSHVLLKQGFEKGFFEVKMSAVCRAYIAVKSRVIKNRKVKEILKQERPYDDQANA
jgi:hypothetical protein